MTLRVANMLGELHVHCVRLVCLQATYGGLMSALDAAVFQVDREQDEVANGPLTVSTSTVKKSVAATPGCDA